MVAMLGFVIVFGAVITGFMMAGGHVGALLHPSEVVTIGGASLGALIVMSPTKVLTDLLKSTLQVFKGTPYDKRAYTELFGLLHSFTRLARREGLLGLDTHVSKPHDSPLFEKYARVGKNHHAVQFLC